MRPESPYLGDVHLLKEYPAGTSLKDITEFEVWNGAEWIHAKDAGNERLSADEQ